MRDYGFYLDRAAKAAGPVHLHAGGSGYFSTPAPALDPHLFDGTHLKPPIRTHLLNTLYDYWTRTYKKPHQWSTVWLAGSGISYQWAADRSNGDLDVLIGVNWPAFITANPAYEGLTPQQLADQIDTELKTELWPRTAHTIFSGQSYEVTYFVNATGSDIRHINPYAAYNVTTDAWTIRPPLLPTNPATLYPKAYSRTVAGESRTISTLVDRYNTLARDLKRFPAGSPGHINATAGLHHITSQARSMWEDIHLGRRAAFEPGGTGYTDYHNYRWQAHKQQGSAQALAAIATVDHDATTHYDNALYHTQLNAADKLIARAILISRGLG